MMKIADRIQFKFYIMLMINSIYDIFDIGVNILDHSVRITSDFESETRILRYLTVIHTSINFPENNSATGALR